jgi:hypothetical protein
VENGVAFSGRRQRSGPPSADPRRTPGGVEASSGGSGGEECGATGPRREVLKRPADLLATVSSVSFRGDR